MFFVSTAVVLGKMSMTALARISTSYLSLPMACEARRVFVANELLRARRRPFGQEYFSFPLLVLKGIYHYWTYFYFFPGDFPKVRNPIRIHLRFGCQFKSSAVGGDGELTYRGRRGPNLRFLKTPPPALAWNETGKSTPPPGMSFWIVDTSKLTCQKGHLRAF